MTEPVQNDEKKPSGLKDKALKIAGASYSIGDLTMARAAHLRGEKDVMSGAAIWLAGGLAAARYGNPNPQKQLELFSAKLEKHLNDQGIQIPDDVREQNELLKKPSFLQKCENFLYQHPSEMLNAAYGIGAALLLKNGIGELAKKEKALLPKFGKGFGTKAVIESVNGISKNFWMGALIGGGALAGLTIKEDPYAKEKAEHGNILQKAAAHIKEKPLRLTGALYGANNIFTVLKTVEDYSNRDMYSGTFKPHHFSGTTAATYILANVLLSTVTRDSTSKNFSDTQLAKLEQEAAQIIAAQPDEKRHPLVKEVAEFMAKQAGIKRPVDTLELEIHNRVHALTGQGPVKPKAEAVAQERTSITAAQHQGTVQAAEKQAVLA